ncbi:MAG: hypothetical protein R8G34_09185 [Paracoccaceae bacterium]|nr:hypothetical protein [Paracoccaceae bacterium]
MRAAAEESAGFARLSRLQGLADAMSVSVIQRNPGDLPELAEFFDSINTDLKMTADEKEEILETALSLDDVREGKDWLSGWVSAMLKLKENDLFFPEEETDPAEMELPFDLTADRKEGPTSITGGAEAPQPVTMPAISAAQLHVETDLSQKGLSKATLLPEEFALLVELQDTIDRANDKLASSSISKTQKPKQTKIRNGAQTRYQDEILSISNRLASEAEHQKEQLAQQQMRQNFDADKLILTTWVGNNCGAGAGAVLLEVLDAHTLGSGATASVTQKFPANDIMEAHSQWYRLYQATNKQTKVFGKFENPGNQEAKIYWKSRGNQWECNRNFIAMIGSHKSNVHVTPKGGNSKPMSRFNSEPSPIG